MLAEKGKSDKLTCPLCGGVFRDPYIATCGVSMKSSGVYVLPASLLHGDPLSLHN